MITKGTVILVRHPADKLVNKTLVPIIRWATESKWNHVAIVGECCGELFVFEAQARGFYPTKLAYKWIDELKERGAELYFLYPKIEKDFDSRVIELIGSTYDFKGAFWHQLGFHLRRKILGIKVWKGYTRDKASKSVYCSEAVAYILGFPYFWKTTPEDLLTLINNQNASN